MLGPHCYCSGERIGLIGCDGPTTGTAWRKHALASPPLPTRDRQDNKPHRASNNGFVQGVLCKIRRQRTPPQATPPARPTISLCSVSLEQTPRLSDITDRIDHDPPTGLSSSGRRRPVQSSRSPAPLPADSTAAPGEQSQRYLSPPTRTASRHLSPWTQPPCSAKAWALSCRDHRNTHPRSSSLTSQPRILMMTPTIVPLIASLTP